METTWSPWIRGGEGRRHAWGTSGMEAPLAQIGSPSRRAIGRKYNERDWTMVACGAVSHVDHGVSVCLELRRQVGLQRTDFLGTFVSSDQGLS